MLVRIVIFGGIAALLSTWLELKAVAEASEVLIGVSAVLIGMVIQVMTITASIYTPTRSSFLEAREIVENLKDQQLNLQSFVYVLLSVCGLSFAAKLGNETAKPMWLSDDVNTVAQKLLLFLVFFFIAMSVSKISQVLRLMIALQTARNKVILDTFEFHTKSATSAMLPPSDPVEPPTIR
jgi:hypothetical protein